MPNWAKRIEDIEKAIADAKVQQPLGLTLLEDGFLSLGSAALEASEAFAAFGSGPKPLPEIKPPEIKPVEAKKVLRKLDRD